MRILVDNGCYRLDNAGDVAMLLVLLDRLRARYRNAELGVVTCNPHALSRYWPDARAIEAEPAWPWPQLRRAYLAARRRMPAPDALLRGRTPALHRRILRVEARRSWDRVPVRQADLVVVSGGGFLTDAFEGHAWTVLERLHAAIRRGTPVALFSQGIGPLRDPALLEKAGIVLPKARLIALREKVASLDLVQRLGVSPERIAITGDDAVEPANRAAAADLGHCIGVNFRVAAYAGVDRAMLDVIRAPLQQAARDLRTSLIAVPTYTAGSIDVPSDLAVAEALIDGPPRADSRVAPTAPQSIMAEIGRCRLVVTGSYHTAVFALSQGVPAVCLSNGEYYETKFRGLRDQFGEGCELLDLTDGEIHPKLIDRITAGWQLARTWRPGLLAAAARQIRAGHEAYDRLVDGSMQG